MEVFTNIDECGAQPSAVCVGVFDGLHLGHQNLIAELVAEAKSRGLISTVVTFDPHPRIVLSKGNDRVGLLTTPEERLYLLAATGVDRVVVVPFTRQFSDLTARQFLGQWLRDKLGAKYLLMGYNHHFGSDDVDKSQYEALAAEEGIEAHRAGAFTLPGEVKVSSSEVRKALEEGDVAKAALLLGRDYSFQGEVVHGDAIGRSIGFRTANILPTDDYKLLPADGVYSGLVSFGSEETFRAVINVGTRPTVGGCDRRVEAHIMDFDADVYGSEARLFFRQKIRDEKKFSDLDALAEQIRDDMRKAALSFEIR